jgi:hypothetical protein
MVVKSSVFYDITACSPLNVSRLVGGTYHFHLQGRRMNQAKNQREAVSKLAGFVCGLFFDPEHGGDMFHRNMRWLQFYYLTHVAYTSKVDTTAMFVYLW